LAQHLKQEIQRRNTMKKLLALTGFIAVIFTGCEVHPYADFTADYTRVQPLEEIRFTNISDRAVSFEWDFGDGTVSTVANPVHYYTDEGTYQVSLRAYSKDNNVDVSYMTIEVLYTLLEVTVVEYNDQEHIERLINDAFVIIYESLYDWENDINEAGYGYTNGYGEITFAGLYPESYWVWAEKVPADTDVDGYDNYDFYLDGLDSYISTDILVPFALNTWIAWVDYFAYYESPNKTIKKNRHEKYAKDKIKTNASSFIIVDVKK
jgi:PKD repeat protein